VHVRDVIVARNILAYLTVASSKKSFARAPFYFATGPVLEDCYKPRT